MVSAVRLLPEIQRHLLEVQCVGFQLFHQMLHRRAVCQQHPDDVVWQVELFGQRHRFGRGIIAAIDENISSMSFL